MGKKEVVTLQEAIDRLVEQQHKHESEIEAIRRTVNTVLLDRGIKPMKGNWPPVGYWWPEWTPWGNIIVVPDASYYAYEEALAAPLRFQVDHAPKPNLMWHGLIVVPAGAFEEIRAK